MNNPFTLSFGKKPVQYISRIAQTERIIGDFTAEESPNQIYMITGVRGSGKTVMMTNIASEIRKRSDEWIVVELNPNRDLLQSLAAKIYAIPEMHAVFVKAKLDFSVFGLGVTVENAVPVTDIENVIEIMLSHIKRLGKRLLITIDEVINSENIKIFASSFQIFLREEYPIYLLMTGLYENIYDLQNEKSLTFLYRAPKIILEPLNYTAIKSHYMRIFDINDEMADKMTLLTRGYPFAFQVLGYLYWDNRKDHTLEDIMPEYDQYLDESNNKIYLMEIRASKILVFDLDGQPQKHIPLAYITHKGRFVINDEKKTVTVMCIPFQGTPTALIWTQDFEGNIIQEYPVSDQFMLIPSTYDYEVRESLNTNASDFYLHNCIASQDTLYHYDIDSNTLHPVFTMHTGHEPICHYFTELPNHFLVTWYTQTSWNNELPRFPKILVDKQSLKGCFVNLKWNMLGNIDGPTNPSFNRGYFTAIMEPYALKEQLEKVLTSNQKLSPEVLRKVKELNNRITDDDNCIVFIGKLKTK